MQSMERFDYQRMVHDALRHVVQAALAEVAEHGLEGDHHFYIAFRTTAEGVEISPTLLRRFPESMTIVLQNQYWELEVDDEGFNVTLSFNRNPEPLRVPYTAIETFADPGAEFGLKFEPEGIGETAEGVEAPAAAASDGSTAGREATDDDSDAESGRGAAVVSIDSFRRK